jgi:hypothetical protein
MILGMRKFIRVVLVRPRLSELQIEDMEMGVDDLVAFGRHF